MKISTGRSRAEAEPEKTRTRVPLGAVLGFGATAALLILVIFSYVRMYEISSETALLQSRLTQLQTMSAELKAEYENSLDLAELERVATSELGMKRPEKNQIIYINLESTDRAEIVRKERGSLQKVIEALARSIEYISEAMQAPELLSQTS